MPGGGGHIHTYMYIFRKLIPVLMNIINNTAPTFNTWLYLEPHQFKIGGRYTAMLQFSKVVGIQVAIQVAR